MTKDINKPLTPKELKDLQKKQPKSSPYEPYKSPFPKAKGTDGGWFEKDNNNVV